MWWDITFILQQLALIAIFSVVILAFLCLTGVGVLFIISLFLDTRK